MIKKTLSALAAATTVLLAAPAAQAAMLPYGVQNDVGAATVAGWGFTECYSGSYAAFGPSVSSVLGACSGDYLMLAARRAGSDVFEVLAAADFADVTFGTGTGNTTHTANGAEWYFDDNWSWGFAGLGDSVNRRSCDTAGSTWDGAPVNERDRLCWHTGSGQMNGGWRAGGFIELNNSTVWEKVVLVGNAVPEPASLALVGLGLLGLGAARRRRPV